LDLPRGDAADNYLFGTAIAFFFLYGVALVRFARARSAADARRAFVVLLCLALLDTSTFAFAHRRLVLSESAEPFEEPVAGAVGSITHPHLLSGFLTLQGLDRGRPGEPLLEIAAGSGEKRQAANDITITGRSYNTLSVHVEAAVHLQRTIAAIKALGCRAGEEPTNKGAAPLLGPHHV